MPTLNIRKLLLKNMSFQMLSHALSLVFSVVSVGILSRYLGVDAFGQFNYIFAFYYFFLIFTDLGIDVVTVREASQRPEEASKIIGTMRSVKLLLSLFLVGVAWLTIYQMNFPEPLGISLKIFAFMLPLMALQMPSLIFQITLKMEYGAVIGFLIRILNFTLIIVLVAGGYKLRAFVIGLVLCELVSVILISIFSRPLIRPAWTLDFSICKKIFYSGLPIALTGIFVAILNRIDFIMLERMTNIHEVGLYSADYKITNLAETLPSMMMVTIFPLMSQYASKDPVKLKQLYQKSNLILTSIGIPMGLAVTFFAPLIMHLIFGSAFIQASHGLRYLIWASVFLYMALPGGHLLISTGHEKVNLYLNLVVASLNILLNFILIPKFSFVGAAMATSACYLFLMIGTRIAVYFYFKNKLPLSTLPQSS